MTVPYQEKVVREPARMAARDPLLSMVFTANLARLVEFVEPELDLDDVVLETCAGTGLISRAIARRVRHVTALDIAPDVLEQGKREADQDVLTNITFTRGDAADLPYVDKSFTLVLTRFSLHHVADPAAVLREMVRVSRPGAGLIVADLVRPDRAAGDPDELERLRDPHHRRLLPVEQIAEMITAAGAAVKRIDGFDVVRPVEQWLGHTGTPPETAERIRAALRADLEGGEPTGLRPVISDGELCVTQANFYFGATAS